MAVGGEIGNMFGFNTEMASMIALCVLVGGIVGSIILGHLLESTNAHKPILVLICFMSMVSSVLICQLFVHDSKDMLAFSFAHFMLGFFVISVVIVAYDLGVK